MTTGEQMVWAGSLALPGGPRLRWQAVLPIMCFSLLRPAL